jgi:hypothetical protein
MSKHLFVATMYLETTDRAIFYYCSILSLLQVKNVVLEILNLSMYLATIHPVLYLKVTFKLNQPVLIGVNNQIPFTKSNPDPTRFYMTAHILIICSLRCTISVLYSRFAIFCCVPSDLVLIFCINNCYPI